MIKIVIPLAGSSDKFYESGYIFPKPLIDVGGQTMIEKVLANPSLISREHQFIFIVKEDECIKFHIDNVLKLLSPSCEVVKLKNETKGGLCSVMMSIDNVNTEDNLLILNGDQIIDIDFNLVDQYWQDQKAAAGLVTFSSIHPRWSYARLENEIVVQTAEKNPISQNAIAGYYYFEKAGDFFQAAYNVIKNDVQLDGAYYISSVLNEFVLQNKKVKNYSIPTKAYHSFYSPHMLDEFEFSAKNKLRNYD